LAPAIDKPRATAPKTDRLEALDRHMRRRGILSDNDSDVFKSSIPLKMLITGRIVVASTHLFTPTLVARIFGMRTASTPAVAYGRMFGIRNAALALGLMKLDNLPAPAHFIRLNILMDAVDAAAWIAAGRRREVTGLTTVTAAGVALSAVAAGTAALLLGRMDR
jgi:hypothetical protein